MVTLTHFLEGNPLPPLRLLFSISSKGSFICTFREETCCHHMDYAFRLAARVLLYASSHRYYGLCYTCRIALAGTWNSSICPPWRIDPTTHRTMSERSYHGATSRSVCLQTFSPSVCGLFWNLADVDILVSINVLNVLLNNVFFFFYKKSTNKPPPPPARTHTNNMEKRKKKKEGKKKCQSLFRYPYCLSITKQQKELKNFF